MDQPEHTEPAVLVVEDDAQTAAMLRRALVYEGYRVATAADGQAALHAALLQPPDLVILDWMLPGMDGLEVCRRLRSADAAIPILMLTARVDVDDRVAGLRGGADDYLAKPFVL